MGFNTCETFDPKVRRWLAAPSLKAKRVGGALAACGSRLLLFGGVRVVGEYLDTVEEYSPASKTWTELPAVKMAARRWFGAATLNDEVYLVGGQNKSGNLNSCERFDASTGHLSPVAGSLCVARACVAAAVCRVAVGVMDRRQ